MKIITKIIRRIAFMVIVFVSGISLLWIAAGWKCALGVFLVLWSHNLEKRHP